VLLGKGAAVPMDQDDKVNLKNRSCGFSLACPKIFRGRCGWFFFGSERGRGVFSHILIDNDGVQPHLEPHSHHHDPAFGTSFDLHWEPHPDSNHCSMFDILRRSLSCWIAREPKHTEQRMPDPDSSDKCIT
jgi:hypothetical protein